MTTIKTSLTDKATGTTLEVSTHFRHNTKEADAAARAVAEFARVLFETLREQQPMTAEELSAMFETVAHPKTVTAEELKARLGFDKAGAS
ncbi:hypothetical protein [Oceanithermus sp.]|uniref:hypothetical protein n=1 Tax=Oceanithermus sp. TaxID=2268145 RepID=UPI00257A5B44|nr:hypothetical protein [Oceanithermus sp.]